MLNRTRTSIVLAGTALAVICQGSGCASQASEEQPVSGVRKDSSGKYEFQVEVVYGPAIPRAQAQYILDNMEIVPVGEAFPDADGSAGQAIEPSSDEPEAEIPTDRIEVILEPLSSGISVDQFAWRIVWTGADASDIPAASETGANQQGLTYGYGYIPPFARWTTSALSCRRFGFQFIAHGSGLGCIRSSAASVDFCPIYTAPFASLGVYPFVSAPIIGGGSNAPVRSWRGVLNAVSPLVPITDIHRLEAQASCM